MYIHKLMGRGIYTWDETKRAANIAKHDIDFRTVEGFDWESALIVEDARFDYGETRYIALGRIGARLHVVVFTPRGDKVHLISLRKANKREVARYDKA